jgi:geranylgeranylglycerol-phosphate geranylgeranyltransferase
VRDLLRLVRAGNLLIAAAGVCAGGWIALAALALPKLLVFAALSGVGLGAAGNALNDLADVAADRVNRPGAARPLAAGRVSRHTAEGVAFAGATLGLAAAALVSGIQVAVAFAALAVMAVYSPWLKRRGLPGNLAVAVVAGLPLFYGALALGAPAAGLVPWALAAWLHFARELVKDLQDEPGDRAAGRRTLPVTVGASQATRIACWVLIGFIPVSELLPWAAGYAGWYFGFAIVAQLITLWTAVQLRRGRLAGASGWLKGAMVAGLAALVLGKVA